MFDNDLIGWEIDDVLEGFEVNFAVDGCAIDSCGEPRDPLLDGDVRDRLDGGHRPSFLRAAEALASAKKQAARDWQVFSGHGHEDDR